MFDSPEFKKFSDDLATAMEDSKRAPNLNCPACGRQMVHIIGSRSLAGYRCCNQFGCVGVMLSVEDLSDSERYNIVVGDLQARYKAFGDMRQRNGWRDPSTIPSAERRALPYCATCKGYHAPTEEHPLCKLCVSNIAHEIPPQDLYFDFKGWRFRPPFHCMCCGMEICYTQWAFGRSCGTCDTGQCRTKHLHQFQDGVFCGPNTEPIDPKEAENSHFTPERMRMVPPAKPMGWRKLDHSIPGYTSGDLNP